MTEPQKIYAVEQGSYSDYSVLGVFTTREKAEEYVARYNLMHHRMYDDAEINEWDLDPIHPKPELLYAVKVMGKKFEEPEYSVNGVPSYIFSGFTPFVVFDRPHVGGWSGQVFGGTPEVALKNAYDWVAEAKMKYIEEGKKEV